MKNCKYLGQLNNILLSEKISIIDNNENIHSLLLIL